MISRCLSQTTLSLLLGFLPFLSSGCHAPSDDVSTIDAGAAEPAPAVPASAPAVTPAPPPEDVSVDERIRAVFLQQSAARESIYSYRLEVAWEERRFDVTPLDQPLPTGVVTSSGTGTLMWQNGKFRVEHRDRMVRIGTMERQVLAQSGLDLTVQPDPDPYDEWAAYNGELLARHSSQYGQDVYIYSREAIEAGFEYSAFLFPNPLEFGFDVAPRNGTLAEMYATSQLPTHSPVTRWKIETVDMGEEGRKIQISRDVDTEHGVWETQILVDPDRDFLAVGMNAWRPPNGKTSEYKLELQQLVDGRWFPKEARFRRPDSYRKWIFNEVYINLDIEPVMFELESFPLDRERTRQLRQDANGSIQVYVFRDGQWVPESLVPKYLRPERR